ncbi:hypothetical protein [Desulfobacterium sp. N47]|uniref:Uncharacterized protein n=1 Tax=uncultured Desulfobacterium sp. TaxID=201089 RepID=E1YIS7_9BACT|nr:unknown protein [uncultured Desulfobacterium sp.]CBX31715.1 unknown protein [uncultured Desulfobacterium sp.]
MSSANLELKFYSGQSVFYEEAGYEPLPCIADRNEIYPFCGYYRAILPMEEVIAVGFGSALLTKNSKCVYVYDEMASTGYGKYMTVAQAEEIAAADPKYDWRIHFMAPLSDLHYQRQGRQNWVLYEKGAGFA